MSTVFDNVGGKIKSGIEKSFLRECIGAGIVGFALLFVAPPLGFLLGPLAAGVLIYLSYRSKLKLYAFGQMVEDLDILAGRLTLVQAQGEGAAQEFHPKTVRIICGACGCEYQGEANDGKSCPGCGSTYRIYPQEDQ